jgi:DNA-binding HxlR family transcriptional regulator
MDDRYTPGSYSQFCPVAMAAEVVCTRWTALVLRELLCGSTRFNDLRRGVPLMSPTLLSKRLKELEEAGVIVAVPTRQPGVFDYKLTEAGEDLRPVVMALGIWGQRWIESSLSLKNLDPSLLMWDMRRWLDPSPLPSKRTTIHFMYPELPSNKRSWWLVIDGGKVDLCSSNPGFEIDLYRPGRADRRQAHRPLHAAMAGPQPVREGEEPRGGLSVVQPTMSSSGLARGSSSQRASEQADGWMVGPSPTVTPYFRETAQRSGALTAAQAS